MVDAVVVDGVQLSVRDMDVDDLAMRVDYFHEATDEDLLRMGVERARLPERERWLAELAADLGRPVDGRDGLAVVWERDGEVVGFSAANHLRPGERCHLHLHVLDPTDRRRGMGAAFVRLSARRYVELLGARLVVSEPNAFNTAPNRTLQRAGFRYVRTHECVPGPINFHQAVTRWELDAADL